MGDGKTSTNGIEIWYEDFGNPDNPTVLLIMGASTQCTAWPMELINPIAEAGFHVARFDNRDMGYSTWIEDYEAAPYTLDDMAADTVGLMDALKIEKAHIIGVSMGGMIAQLMAIHYPTRLLSLTSWASSYWFSDPDVPVMSEEVEAFSAKYQEFVPQTQDETLENQVNALRLLSGSRFPFDEKAVRIRETEAIDRAFNPTNNHGPASMPAPSRLDALGKLDVPALVIHGDEDSIINYCHGVVCAKVIPGATLYTQKGVGHEMPLEIMPETAAVILEHLATATER